MTTKIAHVVLTNGRKAYLARTMYFAEQNVSYEHLDVVARIIVDDSGDSVYRAWLRDSYPTYQVIEVSATPSGYTTAMACVWDVVAGLNTDYVFHLEDDFLFEQPVSLWRSVSILDDNPLMAQVAFKRGPWFANEHKHGGVIQALEHRNRNMFVDEISKRDNIPFTEHRVLFTTNPCVYPKWITEYPWPTEQWSESKFGQSLFTDPHITCAYLGHKHSAPTCTHIGVDKLGHSL
jgi:hypothetical protein